MSLQSWLGRLMYIHDPLPSHDGHRSADQDCGTICALNGNWDVVKHNVLNDQTSSGGRRRSRVMCCNYSDRRIGESAVYNGDRPHLLSSPAAVKHIKGHGAVVDGETLVREAPRPDLVNGCDGIGDL
jgi:hypothetical protein